MKKVIFKGNELYAQSRPTTQEENHHGVADRFDLYYTDKEDPTQLAGKLVRLMKPGAGYTIFHGMVKYRLYPEEVLWVPASALVLKSISATITEEGETVLINNLPLEAAPLEEFSNISKEDAQLLLDRYKFDLFSNPYFAPLNF